MKKLMIAAAIVCAAAFSQAATANWSFELNGDTMVYLPSSMDVASGKAYLFMDSVISQEDVYDAVIKNKGDIKTLGAAASFDLVNGKVAASTFDGPEEATSYFLAVMTTDGKKLFLDDSPEDPYNYNDKTGGVVGADPSWSYMEEYDFTADSSTYQGTGWYAAAVPEPTSGLLLLLGVAGLALRRRRA